MTVLYAIAIGLFLLVCILLSFAILIQESKGTGLGSSFGGEGGDSVFGTSTDEIVKKATATLVGTFLVICVLMSYWTHAMNAGG